MTKASRGSKSLPCRQDQASGLALKAYFLAFLVAVFFLVLFLAVFLVALAIEMAPSCEVSFGPSDCSLRDTEFEAGGLLLVASEAARAEVRRPASD